MTQLTKEYLYKKYVVEKYSMPEISDDSGYSYSNVRYHLKKYGIPLRTRKQSLNTDRAKKKISQISKEKGSGTYERTEEMRKKQSLSMLDISKTKAKGISLKPSGYFEITKGEHKGKGLHVAIMETKLGRKLYPDECVHHIDGDKKNNSINNLALLTKKGHARLHRFEEEIAGNNRNRNNKGQYI